MMAAFSHYDMLGVPPTATQREIRSAWVRAVRISHSDAGGSAAQTAIFNAAYETLKNPEKRRAYDQQLAGSRPTHDTAHTQPPPTSDPEPAWGTDDEWVEDDESAGSSSTGPVSRLSWWYPGLQNGSVTACPPLGFSRRRFVVSAAIFSFLLLPLIAFYAVVGAWNIPFALILVVPALPPSWRARLPLAAVLHVLGWLVVVYMVALVPLTFSGGWDWVLSLYAVALLASLTATVVVARAWDSEHQLDTSIGHAAVFEHNLWGRPGQAMFSGVEQFGQARADEGQLGARLTAQAVECVLDIPGAKMLHGVPWPGSSHTEVDHALVCGNRIAIVDSKLWQPGSYTFDSYGSLLRDGQHFHGGDVYFGNAVAAWQSLLPGREVVGWIVIHTRTQGLVRVPHITHGSLRITTGTEVADAIGTFLVPEAGQVDRHTLARLLTHPDHHRNR